MVDAVGDGQTQIVFIGGSGRSGTNITRQVLASHSMVASLPFEYRFIVDPDGIVDFYHSYSALWSPFMADRRLKRLERLLADLGSEPFFHRTLGEVIRLLDPGRSLISPRRYHGWQLDEHLPRFRQHCRTLVSNLTEFSFSAQWVGTESYRFRPRIYSAGPIDRSELAKVLGDFIRKVIGDLARSQGKSCYVEDNTWNILFANELIDLVPRAKIIHVYRDPRDVVASYVNQRWAPNDPKQAARWYVTLMQRWFDIRSSLAAGSYIELKLEDLVVETEETLRQLCRFVDIPFESKLMETDLSRSNSGRWRREFSTRTQEDVQSVLGEFITSLGYH